ncbi:MAG: ElyC/SanA/YdcF family protein [Verrucomicrobiota bacterium]
MFFLKKLLSRFFFPVPVCAELLLIGLFLLLCTKRQRLAKVFLIAGTAFFLLISLPILPTPLFEPLERKYSPVLVNQQPLPDTPLPVPNNQQPLTNNAPATRLICVLGLGVSANTNLPAHARFNSDFLPRLLEAARLHQTIPGSIILVSIAGKTIPEPDKVKVLAEFYHMMGIPTNHFTVYGDAVDTEGEIRFFKAQAGTNQVLLVSAASHLPRAMLMAQRHGLVAIPAPTAYVVDKSQDKQSPFDPSSFFPGVGNIKLVERATYEYLGLLFEKLK